MKSLDEELRGLLRRKEPPAGFAERLMSRLETQHPRLTFVQRLPAFFRWPVLRWSVTAAVICVALVAGLIRYQHQQQMRAERASREAILALRITNEQIDAALERAQHITTQALEIRKNKARDGVTYENTDTLYR